MQRATSAASSIAAAAASTATSQLQDQANTSAVALVQGSAHAMGAFISSGAAVMQRGAEWWGGESPPPLYHVFYDKTTTTTGEFGLFTAGWQVIHPVLREHIQIFANAHDQKPYDYQCWYHANAPAESKSNDKLLMARASRQYAVLLNKDDETAGQKLYRFGSRLVAHNDTCLLYEMEGGFDVDGMPKLAVALPFNPSDAVAVDAWMVEFGLKPSMLKHFAELSMSIAKRVGGFEVTKHKPESGNDVDKLRFFFDSQEDAFVVFDAKDDVIEESNMEKNDTYVANPKISCLHRFGAIDAGGRAHCKKCGKFMAQASD